MSEPLRSWPDDSTDPVAATPRSRSSDDIVDRLYELIASERLENGHRFPRERDLANAFGISRSTLREALRMLESVGVIRVRAGSGGGIFVSEPGPREINRSLLPALRFAGANQAEIVEYSLGLISDAAYWAGVRVDQVAMRDIASAHNRYSLLADQDGEVGAETRSAHLALLEAVGHATRNRVRVAMTIGLYPALMSGSAAVTATDSLESAEAMVGAIRRRDARAARRSMYQHLNRCLAVEEHEIDADRSVQR